MTHATTTTQEIESGDEAAARTNIVGERRQERLYVSRGLLCLGFVRSLRTGQFAAIGIGGEELGRYTTEAAAATAIISAASA